MRYRVAAVEAGAIAEVPVISNDVLHIEAIAGKLDGGIAAYRRGSGGEPGFFVYDVHDALGGMLAGVITNGEGNGIIARRGIGMGRIGGRGGRAIAKIP